MRKVVEQTNPITPEEKKTEEWKIRSSEEPGELSGKVTMER